MQAIHNEGCGACVVLENHNNVVLIAAIERNEYVVAGDLNKDGSWHWGEYFKDLQAAAKRYAARANLTNRR